MQAQLATQVEPASLSDRDKAALVRLLSDPDPEVFEPVRQTLMTCGTGVRPWLRAGLHSNDRLVRQHSWELITQLDRSSADAEFISFCKRGSENLNLEKGIWLLTRTVFPTTIRTNTKPSSMITPSRSVTPATPSKVIRRR